MNGIIETVKGFLPTGQGFTAKQRERFTKIAVMIGAAGIFLIFLSSFIPQQTDRAITADTAAAEEYGRETEKRLKEILSHVEGAGRVEVMLTIACTEEYIFAEESDLTRGNGGEYRSSGKYVMSGGSPVLKKVVSPQVSGVVVLCTGAESAAVRERIYSAVSAALGLPANRIYVTKIE